MSSDKRMELCQHKKYVGVFPHPHLHMYLLGKIMIKMAVLILVVGVSISWSRILYAAPIAQSSTVGVVGSGGAHLYTSPGGETVAELAPSTVFTAIGRSGDNQWVVVQNSTGQSGWLEVREITIFGLEELPVMLETSPTVAVSATGETPDAVPTSQAPELIPSPTPTPVSSPTPAPTLVAVVAVAAVSGGGASEPVSSLAVVRGGGTGLYDQPGGTQLEELASGIALSASGRSVDGEWLVVTAPSGIVGWVSSADVVVSNLQALPTFDPATGLPAASVAESTDGPDTVAQPTPTSEVTVETTSGQVDATLSTDPNDIIAKVDLIDSRLNIRNGPGTDYLVIGKADPNDTFKVIGRNDEATWIKIAAPEVADGEGWVSAEYIILSQPILSIPVTETEIPTTSPVTTVPTGDIGCVTNQIIKWDSSQGKWICSDDLTILQGEVAALQTEVAALETEIAALQK